jgi:hypothetical protein
VGFQVNNVAGFDVTYEHSSISVSSSKDDGDSSFRILSDRFVASLRLTGPGKVIRPVGMIGGGVVLDSLDFGGILLADGVCSNVSEQTKPPTMACPLVNATNGTGAKGLDALLLGEVALEIDIDRVLVDVGIEAQFQSTGNLQNQYTFGVYQGKPIVNIGPALRIGYRFW